MVKIFAFSAALIICISGAALAQDARTAPGVPAPNTPRVEPNGTVSPAPSQTVTGGVGSTEQTGGTPGQTKTGGPAGGKGTGGSGGGGG